MSQTWISVVIFVVLLALVPLGLKWVQRRIGVGLQSPAVTSKIVSAVGVGPHQRVVTVEVGPEGSRVWLTLGVTAQHITCLHTFAIVQEPPILVDQSVSRSPAGATETSHS